MNKIRSLAEIQSCPNNEALVRYDGRVAYVRSYGVDEFRFHSNPFLSDWFDTLEKCQEAAIDYLFSKTDPLTLLQGLISLVIAGKSEWRFGRAGDLLTISTPSHTAVVDNHLRVIGASDDDIQCSIYGFIESIKPYCIEWTGTINRGWIWSRYDWR